jgi:hypothetical protein
LKYNLPRDCYSKDFCCLVVHYLFLFGVWTSVLTKIFIKRMKYLPTFWRNFIRFVWNFKLYVQPYCSIFDQKIGRKAREACNEGSSMVRVYTYYSSHLC